MKAGWVETKLGEICTVVAGQSPKGSAYNKEADGLPFYQGKKEFTDRYLASPSVWTSQVSKIAEAGDILMSVRAPVGPINEALEKICIGRGLAAIRASQKIDKNFLWFALLFLQPKIKGNSGAVFDSISRKGIEALCLALPPLEEQKRIVAVLDEAFAALDRARTHAETNLKNARELFASLREQKLNASQTGWSVARLEEMIQIKHGFAFKSEFFKSAGNHVLLTPGNYYEDGGYRDRGAKQKYYVGELPDGFVLKKGDLLVAMTEQAPGLLGSCILIPEDDRFLHNQRLGLIQPNNDVDWHPPFFSHVFNLAGFRKALSDTCSGIKVRHTSPKKIYEVEVPIPPTLKDQIETASFLDDMKNQLSNVEKQYEAKLHDLRDLRQSLLQKAFSGELT